MHAKNSGLSLKSELLLFLTILKAGRPRKFYFFLGLSLPPLTGLFEAAGFGILLPILNGIFFKSSSPEAGASFLRRFLNHPFFQTWEGLSLLILAVLAAVTTRLILQYINGLVAIREAKHHERNVRVRVFRSLLSFAPLYFDGQKMGELQTRLLGLTSAVSQAIVILKNILMHSWLVLAYLSILFLLSWKISLLSFFFVAFTFLLTHGVSRFVRFFSQKELASAFSRNAFSFDILANLKLIQSFGREKEETQRFETWELENEKRQNQAAAFFQSIHPLQEWMATVCLAAFFILTLRVIPFKEHPDQAILLLMSLLLWRRAAGAVSAIASNYAQGVNLFPALTSLADLLEPAGKPRIETGGKPFIGLREALEFRKVSMAYGEKKILKDISFVLKKGEVLGITGPSGAGKTTLAELISRFYEFQQGEILVDGEDIRTFDLGSLRRKIGFVTQETLIFNDTIYQNIAYGKEGARPEEVEKVARRAHLHETIVAREQGYDTVIGDRGAQLSGGELQRLAIARIYLKDPEILILDEATNALDLETEAAIQKELFSLMDGRTVILIGHRPSALRPATRHLQLVAGRIL